MGDRYKMGGSSKRDRPPTMPYNASQSELIDALVARANAGSEDLALYQLREALAALQDAHQVLRSCLGDPAEAALAAEQAQSAVDSAAALLDLVPEDHPDEEVRTQRVLVQHERIQCLQACTERAVRGAPATAE